METTESRVKTSGLGGWEAGRLAMGSRMISEHPNNEEFLLRLPRLAVEEVLRHGQGSVVPVERSAHSMVVAMRVATRIVRTGRIFPTVLWRESRAR